MSEEDDDDFVANKVLECRELREELESLKARDAQQKEVYAKLREKINNAKAAFLISKKDFTVALNYLDDALLLV